jgi:hypothetical protein
LLLGHSSYRGEDGYSPSNVTRILFSFLVPKHDKRQKSVRVDGREIEQRIFLLIFLLAQSPVSLSNRKKMKKNVVISLINNNDTLRAKHTGAHTATTRRMFFNGRRAV